MQFAVMWFKLKDSWDSVSVFRNVFSSNVFLQHLQVLYNLLLSHMPSFIQYHLLEVHQRYTKSA